tara:strand:- start:143 stop:565 length:423 start_codon:yes stop_codon:yes gene_type:complete
MPPFEQMTIRWSLFLGFGLILATIAIIHLAMKKLASKHIDDALGEAEIPFKFADAFKGFYVIAIVGFIIVFMWTGIIFHPSENPVGAVDTVEASQAEVTEGDNKPAIITEKLDTKAKTQQAEKFNDLQDFRKEALKNVPE